MELSIIIIILFALIINQNKIMKKYNSLKKIKQVKILKNKKLFLKSQSLKIKLLKLILK